MAHERVFGCNEVIDVQIQDILEPTDFERQFFVQMTKPLVAILTKIVPLHN